MRKRGKTIKYIRWKPSDKSLTHLNAGIPELGDEPQPLLQQVLLSWCHHDLNLCGTDLLCRRLNNHSTVRVWTSAAMSNIVKKTTQLQVSPQPSAPWWKRSFRCQCWPPHTAPSFPWGQTCPPDHRIAPLRPRFLHWHCPLSCSGRRWTLGPLSLELALPHKLLQYNNLVHGPDWDQKLPEDDRIKVLKPKGHCAKNQMRPGMPHLVCDLEELQIAE